MRVSRTPTFERLLDSQLSGDGRPTRQQFEDRLARAVELTLIAFWGDPTYVPLVDPASGIHSTLTSPDPTGMFPPGVFYARRASADEIELLGVDFDWDFWGRD